MRGLNFSIMRHECHFRFVVLLSCYWFADVRRHRSGGHRPPKAFCLSGPGGLGNSAERTALNPQARPATRTHPERQHNNPRGRISKASCGSGRSGCHLHHQPAEPQAGWSQVYSLRETDTSAKKPNLQDQG